MILYTNIDWVCQGSVALTVLPSTILPCPLLSFTVLTCSVLKFVVLPFRILTFGNQRTICYEMGVFRCIMYLD